MSFPSYEFVLHSHFLFELTFCFFFQSYMNIMLYEKALDLFEDDQATFVSFFVSYPLVIAKCHFVISILFSLSLFQVVLHRHLLRTIGASIADMLLFNLVLFDTKAVIFFCNILMLYFFS